MDQSSLVGVEIDDGRRFVERFAADGNPVEAAYWAKSDERETWDLHVATGIYDSLGPLDAYRAAQSSQVKLGDPDLRSLPIQLESPGNPLARAMIEAMTKYPGRTKVGPSGFGFSSVEIAYVYPPHLFKPTRPDPMTTEDIGREIIRLMRREHGLIQPSHVALKDGTAFDGVPFSIQVQDGGEKALVVQFIVDRGFAPRVVGLDQILSIA